MKYLQERKKIFYFYFNVILMATLKTFRKTILIVIHIEDIRIHQTD